MDMNDGIFSITVSLSHRSRTFMRRYLLRKYIKTYLKILTEEENVSIHIVFAEGPEDHSEQNNNRSRYCRQRASFQACVDESNRPSPR